MEETFDKYLDNSADAATLALEIGRLYNFEECFEIMRETDFRDKSILIRLGILSYPFTVETNRQTLFDLIRDVWDIAYNHGRHDALAENSFTLAEID